MSKVQIGENGIYHAKELGIPRMLLLGIQHVFAMFGATILVPILTGLNVQTTLLMAGIGTLLFHLITKCKVPAFLGSSFAFIAGYAAIAGEVGTDGFDPKMLSYACGGVFVAGLVYLLLSALIKFFGAKKIMRFFPPVVTGPIIIAIGLTLAPTAIGNCKDNWWIALFAIAIIIICNVFGKGMIKIVPFLIAIVASYVLALILGEVDFTTVKEADIIGIPFHTSRFMKFSLSAILTIVPISLATMMEHIGDVSAISATVGKNYIADPGLHRTLLGDGIATSLAAVVGAPANTTYGENTGVLALTKVYDPAVIRIAAVVAIILSFFPQVAALINSIPTAIIGGVSLVLYGMISAVGIRNLVESKVDLTKSRNLIIVAAILVLALGMSGGVSFVINSDVTIQLSGLALAAFVGIVLNAVLPGNDYIFSMEEPNQEENQATEE